MAQMIDNLIIGSGPAGLAMAGRFSRQGLAYLLLEQSDTICPAWHQHYDRLHLHTVKEYSHLPYHPFPANYPRYVSRQQLVAYFQQYVKQMQIQAQFGQCVTEVFQQGTHWRVSTESGNHYQARHVILATGFNRKVHMPDWPGMKNFTGNLLHSRSYKNGTPYAGKQVLVVGMGNTGAEIAMDLHEHGASPTLSVRGPVNIVKRDFMGRPTQLTAMKLAKLPHWLYDWLATQISKLSFGDLSPYGIRRPDIPPSRQLREYGKTPVIDVGTVDLIKSGLIQVKPGIAAFEGAEVQFVDGERHRYDAVILATGYKPAIRDFVAVDENAFNSLGYPKSWQADAYPGLYFLGFDAYSTGGLLWSIHRESGNILEHIQANA